MPKLDMDGPFDLTDGVINKKVNGDAIGNFALGFVNKKGNFVVKMIGRADSDLQSEIRKARRKYAGGVLSRMLGRGTALDKFKYSLADTADAAYQVQRRAFEDFGGSKKLLNEAAPEPPGK